jgi:hypothetical protein
VPKPGRARREGACRFFGRPPIEDQEQTSYSYLFFLVSLFGILMVMEMEMEMVASRIGTEP